MKKFKIDPSWTLFLDRDGTINKRLHKDYVKNYIEFEFIEGVLDAIPIMNRIFERSIIVTNQQGVGKKLMTERDLRQIHVKMLEEITENGGYVDEIYYCPGLDSEKPECRKPEIGMALQAVKDFPNINLKKSIMIGDTLTDMQFGRNAGMRTILISESRKVEQPTLSLADHVFTDLLSCAEFLIH
ncbi:D-glycero-alpha-D-manno-heptose-1,7-bisphosphate 7-phosphatase [Portibacter marinus]|uniref:D-glycero-alpha-D-manno-heptose-1,7-bisphosphate 7-phosphatase n=1 Tax=Portibacter marinus TaxID=2898660 RepID=UPI001F280146|nr:HAD family hydrolase [Portibacter marinus]